MVVHPFHSRVGVLFYIHFMIQGILRSFYYQIHTCILQLYIFGSGNKAILSYYNTPWLFATWQKNILANYFENLELSNFYSGLDRGGTYWMEIIIVQIVRTSSRRQLYSYLNTAPYIRAAYIYGYGSNKIFCGVCTEMAHKMPQWKQQHGLCILLWYFMLFICFGETKMISFRVGMSLFYSLLTMSSVTAFLLLGGILTRLVDGFAFRLNVLAPRKA